MSYTIKITNVNDDDTTKQQTFDVKMKSGSCKPSSGNVPKVGASIILTLEPDDATGTIIFSFGGEIPVKQNMEPKKYPDGEDSLWVNLNPSGEKFIRNGDGDIIKVTRP